MESYLVVMDLVDCSTIRLSKLSFLVGVMSKISEWYMKANGGAVGWAIASFIAILPRQLSLKFLCDEQKRLRGMIRHAHDS